jgi:hypothetical protein
MRPFTGPQRVRKSLIFQTQIVYGLIFTVTRSRWRLGLLQFTSDLNAIELDLLLGGRLKFRAIFLVYRHNLSLLRIDMLIHAELITLH